MTKETKALVDAYEEQAALLEGLGGDAVDYAMLRLRLLRDRYIMATGACDDNDERLTVMMAAISEYDKYVACVAKSAELEETGSKALDALDAEAAKHWRNFCGIAAANLEKWRVLNAELR